MKRDRNLNSRFDRPGSHYEKGVDFLPSEELERNQGLVLQPPETSRRNKGAASFHPKHWTELGALALAIYDPQ